MMGHSSRCRDLTTYWDGTSCRKCSLKPGYEVSPNCGRDDNDGFHEPPHKKCRQNTFNTGQNPYCSECSSCPLGYERLCTSTADAVCTSSRTNAKTDAPVKTIRTTPSRHASTAPSKSPMTQTVLQPPTTTPGGFTTPQYTRLVCSLLGITVFMLLVGVFMHRKRRRGQCIKMCLYRGSAAENEELSPVPYSLSKNEPEDILSDNIQSAPLQGVLDNLDVLEELVILLDPETQGIKNTKHLASLCLFPSPWVTYAYSMKETKSPLKAVLERLISTHPDWTVGHLAKMLKEMKRNDAIAVLTKLSPGPQTSKYF